MGDKFCALLFVLLVSKINGQSTPLEQEEQPKIEEKSEIIPEKDMSDSASTIFFTIVEPGVEPGIVESGVEPEIVETGVEPGVEPGDQKVEGNDGDQNLNEDEDLKMIEDLITKTLAEVANESMTEEDNNDDTGIEIFPENQEEPLITANSDQVEVKRQGETAPFAQYSTPEINFSETKEMNGSPLSSSTPLEPTNEENMESISNFETSPEFQLTSGGYTIQSQPTETFDSEPQRFNTESASQREENTETPSSNINGGVRSERIRAPSSYFQPPSFGFNPQPMVPRSFAPQVGAFQNSFYNTQPDLSQSQYSQLVNADEFPGVRFTVQTAPRSPMQNFGLFQNPFQFPVFQQAPANVPAQIPPFFNPISSSGFSDFNRGMDMPAPDFTSLFGNAPTQTFQENPPVYRSSPNFARNIFANPSLGMMSNIPNSNDRSQFSSRFLTYPLTQNINTEPKQADIPAMEDAEKEGESLDETPKAETAAVPFGTRIQKPNEEEDQSDFKRQDNVYIPYPMTEAGYAKEENLPSQNETAETKKTENDIPIKDAFPFFSVPGRYNVFGGPDPYKIALENVQRGYPNAMDKNVENQNGTDESESEPIISAPEQPSLQVELFGPFSGRTPDVSIPEGPFYAQPGRAPFQPIPLFPSNTYPFSLRPPGINAISKTPACAQKSNASLCFDDPEYPRGDVLYALNSDSFLLDRLEIPEQQMEGISLVDQNKSETADSSDNYICKSDIKYGLPLRAKNIKGNWKVIVNVERAVGRGKFVQPIRLEVCRGAGDPCSFTQVQTACVQKYSLQRLLSWSIEKGVHNDVYRLPIACSCQIVDDKV